MIEFLFFATGLLLGIGGTYAYFDAWRLRVKAAFERGNVEHQDEIKRLRKQVADRL